MPDERPVVRPHDHTRFSRGGRLTSAAIAGLTTSSPSVGSPVGGGSGSGGVSIHALLSGLGNDDHSSYATVEDGGGETVYTVAAAGTATTIDPANGNIHDITLSAGTCVVTLSSTTSGVGCGLSLFLRQDVTGSRLVTWPGAVSWVGGTTPTLGTAASYVDVLTLATLDGGTTWYGSQVGTGSGGSVSYATPAIVLGTAAAAGAASTVIRSDSTIAAFSTAVPVTQAYSDAAAAGTAALASRNDHRHGMPASGSGIGEILISDTPSTPLVFADLIQTEAQDDLVYADP